MKVLRGSVPATNEFKITTINVPENGKTYVLGAEQMDDNIVISCVVEGDKADEIAKALTQNPPGWQNGESPFFGKIPAGKIPGAPVCTKTNRPFLQNGPNIEYKVEQIIPADAHEYRNPYGDGKFTVTVTNNGSSKQQTALLQAGGKILGEQSIIAGLAKDCIEPDEDGKPGKAYYAWHEEVPADAGILELDAGKSVTFEIDTLKLIKDGIHFPNGGMRVYFNFIFGDKMVRNFFYYYSATHDAMVEALK